MGRPRKIAAEELAMPELPTVDEPATATAIIAKLVELHDMESRANKNDYDAVRRVRREGQKAWDDARAYLVRNHAS